MPSRSFNDLCCLTQASLLNFCLSNTDLETLDAWCEEPGRSGLSPSVWNRILLHRACQDDPRTCSAISDLLDVRYLDEILLARCSTPEELERSVEAWVSDPDGKQLGGLLWSLCTDPRGAVHALGARLGHEAVVAASRSFSEPALAS